VSEYKVRKDLPPPTARPGRRSQYPLRALKVGECLEVPLDHTDTVRQFVYRVARECKWQFTTQIDRGHNVFRVWRLK